MASFLYLLGCITLSGLSVLEVKTNKRVERVQLYLTLLGALFFCGSFASLVTLAQVDGGRYQYLAGMSVLLLTAGSLFLVSHVSRRFGSLARGRSGQE